MYFFVKYIEYEDFKRAQDVSSLAENISIISIGENKQLIVNPDCYIGIILDYIYKEVGIDDDVRCDFDLATDKGKVLSVNNYQPDYSGLNILNEKNTYYVVYRDSQEQLKPLLCKTSKEYLDFIAYQKKRSSLSKRKSSGSKSSKGSKTPLHSSSTIKDKRDSSKSTRSIQSKTK